MKIDFVIPYVDGSDPIWQTRWEAMCVSHGKKIDKNSVRFRDWGTMRYLFRGIANNASFINQLHLIVQCETQIPEWLNRETVNIVYHDQIIPKQLLPTYNSGTIEMFIHRIPGLSEHFLYGNDDMYIINPTVESDWFDERGYVKLKMGTFDYDQNSRMWYHMLKNSEKLCCDLLNKTLPTNKVMKSDHSISPMRLDVWKHVWTYKHEEMIQSCSPFREAKNMTQEISNFYNYLSGKYVEHDRKNKYFNFKNKLDIDIHNIITSDKYQCICLNDNGCTNFKKARNAVLNAFYKKLPDKCKYEL